LIKQLYNQSPLLRPILILLYWPYFVGLRWLKRKLSGRPLERGMSFWRDMLDWLGGLPFEVAKPEGVLALYRSHGFVLDRMKTCGGRQGCNEFVFRRLASD